MSLHMTQFYQAFPRISTASDKCWGEKAWVQDYTFQLLFLRKQKPEKSTISLFLKEIEDGTTVSFDNIPCSLKEVRILHCQYDIYYFKKMRGREQRATTPRQQKNWLPGKNQDQFYTTYPDYVVPDTTNMTQQQAN